MATMRGLIGSLGGAQNFCLIFALLLALRFKFVNGLRDTANAVATVIYTSSLPRLSPHT